MLVCAGCRAPREEVEARRLADAWIAALNSHDVERLSALLTPNGLYEDVTYQRQVRGPEVRLFWSQVWALFPDLRFTRKAVISSADRVVVEWQSEAKYAGSVVTIGGVSLLEIDEGKIAVARAYYEPGSLLRYPKAQHP
jgi:ketosteroid isomerase-like protein